MPDMDPLGVYFSYVHFQMRKLRHGCPRSLGSSGCGLSSGHVAVELCPGSLDFVPVPHDEFTHSVKVVVTGHVLRGHHYVYEPPKV